MLEYYSILDQENKEGYTPLLCAIMSNHEEVSKLLIE